MYDPEPVRDLVGGHQELSAYVKGLEASLGYDIPAVPTPETGGDRCSIRPHQGRYAVFYPAGARLSLPMAAHGLAHIGLRVQGWPLIDPQTPADWDAGEKDLYARAVALISAAVEHHQYVWPQLDQWGLLEVDSGQLAAARADLIQWLAAGSSPFVHWLKTAHNRSASPNGLKDYPFAAQRDQAGLAPAPESLAAIDLAGALLSPNAPETRTRIRGLCDPHAYLRAALYQADEIGRLIKSGPKIGPENYMELVQSILSQVGLPAEHLRSTRF